MQRRSAATLAAIVEAASQLLHRQGEEALTTNAIAERAGVSVGSVYQYFPNKEAILRTLMMKEREAIAETVERELAADGDLPSPEAVRRVVRALLQAFGARKRGRRRVMQALFRLKEPGTHGELMDRVGAHVILAAAAGPGGRARALTPVSGFVLTRAIMGPIRAAVLADRDEIDSPEFEDELVRLALAFLKPDETRKRPGEA